MQVVGKVRTNDEGLRCPKCGEILKPSLMEEDMFVCPDCIERFTGEDLRSDSVARSEFDDAGYEEDIYVDFGENVESNEDVYDESIDWKDAEPTNNVFDDYLIDEIIDDVDMSTPAVVDNAIEEPSHDEAEETPGNLAHHNSLDGSSNYASNVEVSSFNPPQSRKEKKGHPGLMFLLGFILGVIVTCGVIIALNMTGISIPYISSTAAVIANNNAIEPTNANANANTEENATDNENANEDVPIVANASMRELLKSMGYFDDATVNGKGTQTIDLPVKNVPCIVHVAYAGTGDLKVSTVAKGEKAATLIDTKGPYDGTVTTYFESVPSDAIEVSADGEWQVQLIPMGNMLHAKNGKVSCDNSDVVFFDEESVSKVHFKHDGDGVFKVYAGTIEDNSVRTYPLVDVTGAYDADLDWSGTKTFFYVESSTPWELTWA